MFLIEAGEPFLQFIEYFEARMVHAHCLFRKMALLINQHLALFLKDGGRQAMKPKQLLKVNYTDPNMLMENKDIFVGSSARMFIKKIGFSSESPELAKFFAGVVRYYYESTTSLFKYWETPLSNPFVSNLVVIDPQCKEKETLKKQRDMWDYLATKLNHIVSEEEKKTLLTVELVSYQKVEPAELGIEADEWWAMVAEIELDGDLQLPILSRFALALCPVINSGSEVERDFSDMQAIYSDSKCNRTEQELLESKMAVKSAVKAEAVNCARCIEAKKEIKEKKLKGERVKKEKCTHCHCSFLEVGDELLNDLRNCEPGRKFNAAVKQKALENEAMKKELEDRQAKDILAAERDLKREVTEMKRRFQEATVKAIKEKRPPPKKVPKKRVAIEKVETDLSKRKKLSFLLTGPNKDGISFLWEKDGGQSEKNKSASEIKKRDG